MTLLYPLMISSLFVVFYYGTFKKLLRRPSYWLAKFLGLTKKYSLEEAAGAIGFILTTLSHFLFFLLLCFILNIHYHPLGISHFKLRDIFLGLLLGLGIGGNVAMVAMILIKFLIQFTPLTQQQLFVTLSCGWLKKYEYLRSITPIFISIPFIFLQLACEELIFRGVFVNYLLKHGVTISILISTLLFSIMQTFQMPNLRASFFPLIGALAMGPIHSYLFLATGSIWPFIFSHFSFFILFTL